MSPKRNTDPTEPGTSVDTADATHKSAAVLLAELRQRLADLHGRRRVREGQLEESVERGQVTEADLAAATAELGELDAEIRTVSFLERAAATRARQEGEVDDERAYYTAVDECEQTFEGVVVAMADVERLIGELSDRIEELVRALDPADVRAVADERLLRMLQAYPLREPFLDMVARRLRTAQVLRDAPMRSAERVFTGDIARWVEGRTGKIIDLARRHGPHNKQEDAS